MLFKDFLGGTSSWQQFSYDVRTYFRLSKDARHKLALWTFGDLVTGGEAPYLDLPSTGATSTRAPDAATRRGGSAARGCCTPRRSTAGP